MSVETSLHRAAQAYSALYDQEARSRGLLVLSLRHLSVMETLCAASGPRNQTGLVRLTGIDRSTLTEMLKRMERDCLVERMPGYDARTRVVRPTVLGRRRLKHSISIRGDVERKFINRIPLKDQFPLLGLLAKLAGVKADV